MTARQVKLVLPLLLLTFCLGADSPSEYEVKAAFLLNFTKFIEWPQPPAGRNNTLAVCIVGEDPFGATLDQTLQGESLGNRQIVPQRVLRPGEDTACDIAFFSSKAPKDTAKVLSAFPSGVLTVGEGEDFLRQGGMIAFVVDNRRVRFDINMPAVRAAGLKMSSRLLNVARAVTK